MTIADDIVATQASVATLATEVAALQTALSTMPQASDLAAIGSVQTTVNQILAVLTTTPVTPPAG